MNNKYLNIEKIFGKFRENEYNWIESQEAMVIPCLGNDPRKVVLSGFLQDENKNDYFEAICNLMAEKTIVTGESSDALFQYFMDNYNEGEFDAITKRKLKKITKKNVWDHVDIGKSILVSRRLFGDRAIYISIESECDWEDEHGLEIVMRNGMKVTKLGSHDGHCTNVDAFGHENFENVVYVNKEMMLSLLKDPEYMKRLKNG